VESVSRRWPIALPGTVPGRVPITRLMAVVFADMAGYSRLFALDDTGTVARLRMVHNELIEPAIRHHHGRLVQTGGDSMLIIFESVAQAVKCAVTIQSEIAINADYWPIDQKMRFRIGVDLGDIIMDGMNFHGDGVIVACGARAWGRAAWPGDRGARTAGAQKRWAPGGGVRDVAPATGGDGVVGLTWRSGRDGRRLRPGRRGG
jgi:class 3 adenylate cyclase